MKYSFKYGFDSQIKLYINRLLTINSGFFFNNRFPILPYKYKDYWFLPDVGIFRDEKMRSRLKVLAAKMSRKRNYFYLHDKAIFEYVKDRFINEWYTESNKVIQDIAEFKNISDEFFRRLNLVCENLDDINHIYIIPSNFGTHRSFSSVYLSDDRIDLYISYKVNDLGTLCEAIVGGIVNHLTRHDVLNSKQENRSLWNNRTFTTNFLLKQTGILYKMSKLRSAINFQDSQEIEEKVLSDSLKYYREMGFDKINEFCIKDDQILFKGIHVNNLTRFELIIFKVLFERKKEIITYDEIAFKLWKDEWRERFNLDSISKNVIRLKKKLSKFGVMKNSIQNIRNIGYVLID